MTGSRLIIYDWYIDCWSSDREKEDEEWKKEKNCLSPSLLDGRAHNDATKFYTITSVSITIK